MLCPELPLVDLGDVREQLCGVRAVATDQVGEALKKFLFGQLR